MPASPFHQKLFYLGKHLVSAGSKATSQTNLHEKMRIYFQVKIHRKKAESRQGRQQEGRRVGYGVRVRVRVSQHCPAGGDWELQRLCSYNADAPC